MQPDLCALQADFEERHWWFVARQSDSAPRNRMTLRGTRRLIASVAATS
jgi:hypothetical protein